MPHEPEQKRLAGQKGRSHGIYAIKARAEAAMTPTQVQTLRDIEEQLQTPEGVQQALLERVAMATAIMGTLEAYIGDRVEDGVPLDAITILRSWPAFQNSTVRALKQLMDAMPDDKNRAGHAQLGGEMTERVEKFTSVNAKAKAEMREKASGDDDEDVDS